MASLPELIKLERPLHFLDVETTGKHTSRDKIVQICVISFYPDGTSTVKSSLVNPRRPIPVEVSAIHGITNDAVKDAPAFGNLSKSLYDLLQGQDVSGYNVRFDIDMLKGEFIKHGFRYEPGQVVDVFHIFTKFYPRNLSAAVKTYLGREHVGAHDATEDVKATIEVLLAQLQRHEELPRSVDALASWLSPKDPDSVDSAGKLVWRNGEATWNFGKHSGLPLRATDVGYLHWLMGADFNQDLKDIVENALKGNYPKKKEAKP